jgi:hypothetical protein
MTFSFRPTSVSIAPARAASVKTFVVSWKLTARTRPRAVPTRRGQLHDLTHVLAAYAGKHLTLPARFAPDGEALAYHRERVSPGGRKYHLPLPCR